MAHRNLNIITAPLAELDKDEILRRKVEIEILLQLRDEVRKLNEKIELMSLKADKEWYSVSEFAEATNTSVETIRKRCQRGYYKVQDREIKGGKYLIHCSELLKQNPDL